MDGWVGGWMCLHMYARVHVRMYVLITSGFHMHMHHMYVCIYKMCLFLSGPSTWNRFRMQQGAAEHDAYTGFLNNFSFYTWHHSQQ